MTQIQVEQLRMMLLPVAADIVIKRREDFPVSSLSVENVYDQIASHVVKTVYALSDAVVREG